MANSLIIANDIFTTIKTISGLAEKLETVRSFSKEEQEQLTKIGALMPVLFEKIVRYYEQDEQTHILSFQQVFDYPLAFNRPQTLEIIITWIYGLLMGIQKQTCYILFVDFDHAMYANQLINGNKSKIQQLIKSR